jgi:hypothetical protein
MTVTPASFKVRFPEYVSESDDRIQLFLDDAVLTLNFVYWGVKYDLGVNYLVAHELALANKSEQAGGSGAGAGGTISSRSVDGVSISYAVRTADSAKEAYYAQTSYGFKFWALLRSLPIPAISI